MVSLQGEAERLCLDYVSHVSQLDNSNAGLTAMAGLVLHSPHLVIKGVSRVIRAETEIKHLAQSTGAYGACQKILESYDLCLTIGEEQSAFVFLGCDVTESQYGRAPWPRTIQQRQDPSE